MRVVGRGGGDGIKPISDGENQNILFADLIFQTGVSSHLDNISDQCSFPCMTFTNSENKPEFSCKFFRRRHYSLSKKQFGTHTFRRYSQFQSLTYSNRALNKIDSFIWYGD